MSQIQIPNIRTGTDVPMKVRLTDSGVRIDWATLDNIAAYIYSDAQMVIAGKCSDIHVDPEDNTALLVEYPYTENQYLGVQSLVIIADYLGQHCTFDKPAFAFVATTEGTSGTTSVEDDAVAVDITVEDVDSSILSAAIRAALEAAEDAEEAAHLVPLQVLQDCVEATAGANEAAETANAAAEHAIPIIGENGNWWKWDAELGQYVDTGDPSRGIQGVSIQSVEQTQTSEESQGINEITVTLDNGQTATFQVRNGAQGATGAPGVANAKYKQVSALPVASAATMDYIYLVASSTAGIYDMSYTEYDPDAQTYSWHSLGTTAIQLSDYATKEELSQLGQYVDNPEFVYVKTDSEDKILFGIKVDGEPYFGVGCPQQVKDYIEYKISLLSLDEYEDIVAFLNDYLGGDATLKVILDEINAQKVDKEKGKSLIDADYSSSQSAIDNPEYLQVTTDSDDKILEGIKKDGTKVIGADLDVGGNTIIGGDTKILGNMEVSGISYKVIENSEYLVVWVDAEDKVIFGIKADGKTYIGNADFLDYIEDIKAFITAVENPEFIDVTLDSEGKVLAGRTLDGAAFENVCFITPKMSIGGAIVENIEDPEDRTEITLDSDNKIISYRDSAGVKHEGVKIVSKEVDTDCLKLSDEGLSDFERKLKAHGFIAGFGDWSDYLSEDGDKPLHLPIPRCAIVNLTNDTKDAVWPPAKFLDLQYYIEYFDIEGNYFKKKVFANAQGNSSLGMPKKNLAIDLFDSDWDEDAFSVKFGNWVPQDSFHLKAYYADYFVGVCAIGYKLFDQIVSTRDVFTNRDWKKALLPSKEEIGIDCQALAGEDDKYSLDNDARCYPDGFPVIAYLNGEFYGVYSWQLKKHRDNYMMSKKKPKHIHLDGCISDEAIFLADGNLNWDIISAKTADSRGNRDGIEIRNPKPKSKDGWILTCADGTQYDGDTNMNELMGQDNVGYDSTNNSHVKSNQVKQALIDLSTRIPELRQMEEDEATSEAIRAKIEEYFDVESFIDYLVLGNIVSNYDGFRKNWQWLTWDGTKWYIEPYDMDGIFGWSGWGDISPTTGLYGGSKDYPSGWIAAYFQTELNARYAELRDAGIITTKNIVKLFQEWIAAIGTDNMQLNHDKWPNDREHYSAGPVDTHYDSIYRVSNWLDLRITKCDEIFNYN